MRAALLTLAITTAACVNSGPAPVCTTVSSERITPRESLTQLDGASLNDWFDDVEPGLTWDIQWMDIADAPSEDTLTMTLERQGQARLEELRPIRPETADTPDSLRGLCVDGPYVQTEVSVQLQTDSGASGEGTGNLILLGPDLASAILELDVTISGPQWLVPGAARATCVGETRATLGFGADARLDTPSGFVGTRQDNCAGSWGEWTAVP